MRSLVMAAKSASIKREKLELRFIYIEYEKKKTQTCGP